MWLTGFGEGIAKLFAEEGAKIVVADINEAGGQRWVSTANLGYFDWLTVLRSTVKEIVAAGGGAVFAKTDVTKEEDWRKALEIAKSEFGTLDILVNNAGWTYKKKDTLSVTEAEYDRKWRHVSLLLPR
jgi:3-oxoacyl-[acyl-carrier protein] reductase